MPRINMTPELYEKLKVLGHCIHSPEGWEIHDPDKIATPVGLKRPLTLKQQIQRLMRVELSNQVASQGMETFEEANDFNISDPNEEELRTIYEMPDESPNESPLKTSGETVKRLDSESGVSAGANKSNLEEGDDSPGDTPDSAVPEPEKAPEREKKD